MRARRVRYRLHHRAAGRFRQTAGPGGDSLGSGPARRLERRLGPADPVDEALEGELAVSRARTAASTASAAPARARSAPRPGRATSRRGYTSRSRPRSSMPSRLNRSASSVAPRRASTCALDRPPEDLRDDIVVGRQPTTLFSQPPGLVVLAELATASNRRGPRSSTVARFAGGRKTSLEAGGRPPGRSRSRRAPGRSRSAGSRSARSTGQARRPVSLPPPRPTSTSPVVGRIGAKLAAQREQADPDRPAVVVRSSSSMMACASSTSIEPQTRHSPATPRTDPGRDRGHARRRAPSPPGWPWQPRSIGRG